MTLEECVLLEPKMHIAISCQTQEQALDIVQKLWTMGVPFASRKHLDEACQMAKGAYSNYQKTLCITNDGSYGTRHLYQTLAEHPELLKTGARRWMVVRAEDLRDVPSLFNFILEGGQTI